MALLLALRINYELVTISSVCYMCVRVSRWQFKVVLFVAPVLFPVNVSGLNTIWLYCAVWSVRKQFCSLCLLHSARPPLLAGIRKSLRFLLRNHFAYFMNMFFSCHKSYWHETCIADCHAHSQRMLVYLFVCFLTTTHCDDGVFIYLFIQSETPESSDPSIARAYYYRVILHVLCFYLLMKWITLPYISI